MLLQKYSPMTKINCWEITLVLDLSSLRKQNKKLWKRAKYTTTITLITIPFSLKHASYTPASLYSVLDLPTYRSSLLPIPHPPVHLQLPALPARKTPSPPRWEMALTMNNPLKWVEKGRRLRLLPGLMLFHPIIVQSLYKLVLISQDSIIDMK